MVKASLGGTQRSGEGVLASSTANLSTVHVQSMRITNCRHSIEGLCMLVPTCHSLLRGARLAVKLTLVVGPRSKWDSVIRSQVYGMQCDILQQREELRRLWIVGNSRVPTRQTASLRITCHSVADCGMN